MIFTHFVVRTVVMRVALNRVTSDLRIAVIAFLARANWLVIHS